MGAMTDEEKFQFDLQGYLVIRNVLSKEECAELSVLADSVWPEEAEDDYSAEPRTFHAGIRDFLI